MNTEQLANTDGIKDDDIDLEELTEKPFRKGFLYNDYQPIIEAVHQALHDEYHKSKAFHDEYLTPTSTEHIVDTQNQPATGNTERAHNLERLNQRTNEMYKTYDTTPRIDHDNITVEATPTDYSPDALTHALRMANNTFTATTIATGALASSQAFGITTEQYLIATGAGIAGFLATKAGQGIKAAYHANKATTLHRKYKDNHYHDDTPIKATVLAPMIAHAKHRQHNDEAIQQLVDDATTNHAPARTP